MHQRVEHLALLLVARACVIAALANLFLMLSLSSSATSALQAGGLFSLIFCLVLLIKAQSAAGRSYQRTQVWAMLDPDERPSPAIAQGLIADVLRDTYLRVAMHASLFAISFFLAAIIMAAYLPA